VCRGIRRRHYTNCRDVRLDVWRVFANCVKYNSHPTNKDAVPSFVSIALHLRDYFNNLWQEYLLPSDPPAAATSSSASRRPSMVGSSTTNVQNSSSNIESDKGTDLVTYEVMKAAFAKRDEERNKRLENSGVLVLSKSFTTKASNLLLEFIENGGCVDSLDTVALFGPQARNDDRDVDLVIQRLGQYHAQLEEVSESESVQEYTLDAFHKDLTKCYTEHVLEDNPSMRNRFRCRLDRFFWKQAVPLHEANSRGVTQSSIWGNLAATIWARESSKKPYWPALCLGILPPAEQREGWHQAVTERNESRLPEKLRVQLMIAKKRCEQAQKRQSLSYFLVEFLGTHEFIWVRETDIIENFDPNSDPNKNGFAVKKSRSTSSVVGSKTYATAIQECVWASEEYENVLQDAFENVAVDDDDDDEINFSFQALAQSDEEADEEGHRGYRYDNDNMDISDAEEANYLISHDGILDTSAAGRKIAKKRSQSQKKQAAAISKRESIPAAKDESLKKKRSRSKVKNSGDLKEPEVVVKDDERQEKKDHRDLERRRKKRLRDHEKLERVDSQKKTTKRRRSISNDLDEGDPRLMNDKKARATVIVKAYLNRLAKQNDCKSLALSGVLTMPSALVDSVGILGLALGFRAASGGLYMPDATKEELAKLKPWVVVDTDKPKTSGERMENLQRKIDLLEAEIGSIRNDTQRRRFLASEYTYRRNTTDMTSEADDTAARFNHFKKKRKLTPSKSDGRSDFDSPDEKMLTDGVQEASFEMEDDEGVEECTNDNSDNDSEDEKVAMMVDEQEIPGIDNHDNHAEEGESD
jgi:hypothetical protein